MLPKEIQDLIKSLAVENQSVVQAIAMLYESKIQKLEARIKALEDQISKNSRNSSKPPKSLRKKSHRNLGGQEGHCGDTLKMCEHPDEIIRHQVEYCACCQRALRAQKADCIERRQVYDIPSLRIKVIEHRSEVKTCSCGLYQCFPTGVGHHVAYGSNIKSLLVYLQNYQLLPYERTAELISDLFNHNISKGTLFNIGKSAYDRLEVFEDRLKELLSCSKVVGFDETGARVMSKRLWSHSCSTSQYAY